MNAAKQERDQLLACFPFSKPERMSGVWVIGLERSSFFENTRRYGPSLEQRYDTWLYVEDATWKKVAPPTAPLDQWFHVELIGRRSMCDGMWGHMGISPKAVIVDRVLSITG